MKKSQVWYVDFGVAMSIVIISTIMFLNYVNTAGTEENISSLATSSARISESLMSVGVPSNWNSVSVKSVGLTNNNWIFNHSKIFMMYNLSNTKLRYGLSSDYNVELILFNSTGGIIIIDGMSFAGKNSSTAKKVASISRYGIYNSSVAELRVVVWE